MVSTLISEFQKRRATESLVYKGFYKYFSSLSKACDKVFRLEWILQ